MAASGKYYYSLCNTEYNDINKLQILRETLRNFQFKAAILGKFEKIAY